MQDVQFEKNEVRNTVFKIIGLILIIILFGIIFYSYSCTNCSHDYQLAGKKYYTEDTCSIYQFNTDQNGFLNIYEHLDNDDPEKVTSSDRYSFSYTVDIDSNTVIIDIDNYNPAEIKLLFIRDGLLDITQNKYYYEFK